MSPFFKPRGYGTFADLARNEPEGDSWTRLICSRPSAVLIAAPHGGGIEQGTTEVARAVAGEEFALYSLVGLKARGNNVLHLTSTRFDDPVYLEMAARARVVVAIHGCEDAERMVAIGGLHAALAQRIAAALRTVAAHPAADFATILGDTEHPGADARNLCNRGRDGRGVQLEISRGLREALFAGLSAAARQRTTDLFVPFVLALRTALLDFERELKAGAPPIA